ncbi:MAG: hypothetical protein GY953_20145, partial [bacterium]|nr:hypothetical protein [bacterium]
GGHTSARLHSQKTKAGTVVRASPYGITKRGQSPALVFNRYGTKHYLKRIRTASFERQIPRSKGEREMLAAWGKPEKATVVAQTR